MQEHLEGETLRVPLSQGALPLKKALDLGTEMAEALAAAHGANIVHRGLKPANVFITPEGHAKVLDFGLAKLIEPEQFAGEAELSRSPTMLGTVAGQVMGTAGYMAPEQVAAEEIDHRADIFAFGCVLYEMAGGKQVFTGASVLDTLHANVHDDPQALGQIKPGLPAELQRILKKCLAKERSGRYQAASELATDLRSLAAEVEAGTAVPLGAAPEVAPSSAAASPGRKILMAVAAAAMVVVGVLAGIVGWGVRQPPAAEERPLRLFEIDLGINATPAGGRSVAVSPDGRYLIWAGVMPEPDANPAPMLYLRRMDQAGFTPIPGTEGAQYPFVSPDSQWIGFGVAAGDQGQAESLMKVSIDGGAPFELCACFGVATWADDDNIYLAPRGGQTLQRLPGAGAIRSWCWRRTRGEPCFPSVRAARQRRAAVRDRHCPRSPHRGRHVSGSHRPENHLRWLGSPLFSQWSHRLRARRRALCRRLRPRAARGHEPADADHPGRARAGERHDSGEHCCRRHVDVHPRGVGRRGASSSLPWFGSTAVAGRSWSPSTAGGSEQLACHPTAAALRSR